MSPESTTTKLIFWILGALLMVLVSVGGFAMKGMAETQTDHRVAIIRNTVAVAENRKDVSNFHDDLIRIEHKIDDLTQMTIKLTQTRDAWTY